MLKKCLLALIATGLISVTATFAAAQDSQSNDQQAPPPAQENGMRHHGFDPAQRTAQLTKQLKLNSDQQAKVQAALESERSQMGSLHQDSSLSREDKHAKMMDIHQATNTQIRGLLDANQQKKFDEIQSEHEQRMQEHRQGPPDAGSGQPPQ
jgi:hypothetical protein